MEVNPLLKRFEKDIKKFLKDDLNFQIHFDGHNVIKKYLLEDEEKFEFYLNCIISLSTDEFIKILIELEGKQYTRLAKRISETWKDIIDEIKQITKNELANVSKLPFLNLTENTIHFANIITPIEITSQKVSTSDLLSKICQDNIEFIDDIQNFNRILITGGAGVGKTYHFKKIRYLWARRVEKEPKCLILKVTVAEVMKNEKFDEILFNQNAKNSKWITFDLFKHYISEKCEFKKNILLLIDGADEVQNDTGLLKSIIENAGEVNFPIIVWSRTWKAEQIKRSYDNILQIFGYSEENVKCFFRNFYHEDTNLNERRLKNNIYDDYADNESNHESIFNFLKKNRKDLLRSCSNPLIAIITAFVWQEKAKLIRHDELSIYEDAVEILLLPDKRNSKKFHEKFDFMMERAFKNFFYNIPIEIFKVNDNLKDFGNILVPFDCKFTDRMIFRFIHFSFLEYFTSKFIIKCIRENDDCLISTLLDVHGVNRDDETLITMICNQKPLIKLKTIFSFIQNLDNNVFSMLVKKNPDILVLFDKDAEDVIDLIKERCRTKNVILRDIKLTSLLWNIILDSYSRQITSIKLYRVEFKFENAIELIIENLSDTLEELTIIFEEKIIVSSFILENITNDLTCLKKLLFSNISLQNSTLPWRLISQTLECLTLENCSLFENMPGAFCCWNLSYLNISENKIKDSSILKKLLNSLIICQELKSIDLSSCSLSSNCFELLKNFIQENKSIREIDISGNKLNNKDIRELLIDLENREIHLLSLDSCSIGYLDKSILSVIKKNPLVKLHLLGNKLSENLNIPFLTAVFSKKTLKSLKLPLFDSDGLIFDKEINIEISGCKSVEYLNFGGNSLDKEFNCFVLGKFLKVSKHIKILDLGNTDDDDDGFNGINTTDLSNYSSQNQLQLRHLHSINASGNNLSTNLDNFLNLFNLNFKKRMILNFSNCCLNQDCLSIFSKINSQYLNISNNNLSTILHWNDFEFLPFKNLKELQLKNCNLKSEFLDEFLNIFKIGSNLETLDISENNFGDKSLLSFIDNDYLANSHLKYLYIYGGNLSIKVFFKLLTAIRNMKKLKILNSRRKMKKKFTILIDDIVNSKDFTKQLTNVIVKKHTAILQFKSLKISDYGKKDLTYILQLLYKTSYQLNSFIIDDILLKSHENSLKKILNNQMNPINLEILTKTSIHNILPAIGNRINDIFINSIRLNIQTVRSLLHLLQIQKNIKKFTWNYGNFTGKIGTTLFMNIPDSCCSITELILHGCNFDGMKTEYLGTFIGYQTQLTKLDLSYNQFIGECGTNLFRVIPKTCCSILIIDFTGCEFEGMEMEYLARFIGYQINLNELIFSWAILSGKVGTNLFMHIPKTCKSITTIDLSHAKVEDVNTKYLGKFIDIQENLRKFDLNNINLSGKIGSKLFKSITENCFTLVELILDGCDLNLIDAEYLGKFIGYQKNLSKLDMSNINLGGNIGTNIFKNLPEACTAVTDLNMRYSKFAGMKMKYFAIFINNQSCLKTLNLRSIDFSGKMGDKFFINLTESCCSITELELSSCRFDGMDTTYLGKFIGKQIQLQNLQLAYTNLCGSIGTDLFMNIPDTCCSITTFNLVNCKFNGMRTEYLGRFLSYQRNLTNFHIKWISLSGEIKTELFNNMPEVFSSLNDLDFSNCNFEGMKTGTLGTFIGNQRYLSKLNFSSTKLIGDIGTKIFMNIPLSCSSVTELLLSECVLDGMETEYIGKFIGYQKKLKKIDFKKTNLNGQIGTNLFMNIPEFFDSIQELNFSYCSFEGVETEYLGKFISNQKHISKLDLSWTDFSGEKGTNFFGNIAKSCNTIKELDLNGCKFSGVKTEFIGRFICYQKNLNKLHLLALNLSGNNGTNIFKHKFKPCYSITVLNFYRCKFDGMRTEYLGRYISYQKNLKILNLSWTNISNQIGTDLFKNIIETCCSISKLYLNGCIFEGMNTDYIARFIGYQKSLMKIHLGWTNLIGDTGTGIFMNISEKNCRFLSEIDFSDCIFTEMKTEYIGKFLSNQTSLTKINFTRAQLCWEEGTNLFKNISSSCNNLSKIVLQGCKFDGMKTEYLGKFISYQKNLMKLDLSKTYLGGSIGTNLFKNITDSCNLISDINFRKCKFSGLKTEYLGRFIGYQKNLKKLNLSHTNLNGDIGTNLFKNIPKIDFTVSDFDLSYCDLLGMDTKYLGQFISCLKNLFRLDIRGLDFSGEIGTNLFMNIAEDSCNSISELDFNDCEFEGMKTLYLGKFIGFQKNLTLLDLNSMSLCGECGTNMFKDIKPICKTLNYLELSNCEFDCMKTKHLGLFIGYQKNLYRLNLYSTNLSGKIGTNLFKNIRKTLSSLSYLGLSLCEFEGMESEYLGQFINFQKNLKVLDLSYTNLSEEIGTNIFKNITNDCSSLEEIMMNKCILDGVETIYLAMFIGYQRNLIKLDFTATNLSQETGTNLFKNIPKTVKSITELNFSNCQFEGIESEHLGKFISFQKYLSVLNLCRTNLRDEIGTNLFKNFPKSCNSFSEIYLDFCEFQNMESVYLANFISNQKNIRLISLNNTNLGGNFGTMLFKNIPQTCCFLQSIHLNKCKFKGMKTKYLGKFIGFQQHLNTLDLRETSLTFKEGTHLFKYIPSTCCHIVKLDFSGCEFDGMKTVYLGKFIGYQKNIKELSFCSTNLNGEIGTNLFMSIPQNCCTITDLNFSCCKFKGIDSQFLGKFIGQQKYLEKVNFQGTDLREKIGTNLFVNVPVSCSTIEELDLKNCELKGMELEHLAKFIGFQTNLRKLDINWKNICAYAGTSFFKHLPNSFSSLYELDLSSSELNDVETEYLGKFISYQKNLEKLYFSFTNLSGKIGTNLFKNISNTCCRLTELDLTECDFEGMKSKHLGKFIGFQKHLIKLNLRRVNLSKEIGTNLFQNIPEICRSINEIILNECEFEGLKAEYLGRFIGYQKNLLLLDLTSTNLSGNIGTNLFMNIPKTCCYIFELDFNGCKFEDMETEYLGRFICYQKNLKKLLFSRNNLSEKIGTNLFKSIDESCCSIIELSFDNCVLEGIEFQYLKRFILYQKKLIKLSFNNTKFDEDLYFQTFSF